MIDVVPLGLGCAADAIQTGNEKPKYWYGKGEYCNYNTQNNESNDEIILCGRIESGKNKNNLTDIGNLDWIHFENTNIYIRKNINKNKLNYINNITSKYNNINIHKRDLRQFYWNDGNEIKIQSKYNLFILLSSRDIS